MKKKKKWNFFKVIFEQHSSFCFYVLYFIFFEFFFYLRYILLQIFYISLVHEWFGIYIYIFAYKNWTICTSFLSFSLICILGYIRINKINFGNENIYIVNNVNLFYLLNGKHVNIEMYYFYIFLAKILLLVHLIKESGENLTFSNVTLKVIKRYTKNFKWNDNIFWIFYVFLWKIVINFSSKNVEILNKNLINS